MPTSQGPDSCMGFVAHMATQHAFSCRYVFIRLFIFLILNFLHVHTLIYLPLEQNGFIDKLMPMLVN